MFDFALRAVGMYFLALIMIRLLGKRALGELGPFDFVVMTGVGHTVVSVALDRSLPFYEGIVILVTLAILEYLMGYLALKSARLSDLITGVPIVLIDNGKIIRENLAKEKFNVDDLLQELRKQGIRDIHEVDKGILESCGGFSVILKEEEEPVTRRDLGIYSEEKNEFLTIVNRSRAEYFNHVNDGGKTEDRNIFEILHTIDGKLNDMHKRLDKMEERVD
ncbi:MAG: DUF421 domain-containing protein [Bacillota bacterium]|nr:DUF421 domain-containing protein [Bacillota bacterium]